MNLSGKKLTTAILAGLMGATMFGGSVFAEVSDQEFSEVRQGVNANTQRILHLENAQSAAKDYSTDIAANKTAISDETTARQDADTKLQGSVDANKTAIDANKTAISDEAKARQDADTKLQGSVDANKTAIDANKTAISDEAKARQDADTKLDTRITNVKEYLENQTAASYVSKTDAAVQDGAVAKAGNTIGENVTNLDGALAKETAARIGADAAQDKVIQQVNQNVADSFNTLNKNIGTITDQLNKNDLAEAQARDAADQTLQKNIDAETTARQTDVANLQTNIKDALTNQNVVNDTLTKAVQANSNAIVTSSQNLKKHLSDTDGRVDKANAEIHTNAGNIAQNKKDIADIQNTLKDSNAVASANATKAATQAANDATAAAKNANDVANGLKDRVDLISNNQNVTSESDLIKKDQSVGQNLTNVDTALHKEIAARIGADAAQDKVIEQVNKNVTDGFNNINKNVAAGFTALNQADANEATARDKADQQEAQTRAAEDTRLNTKMDKGFATIQGQQDEQDAKIGKNQKDIQTNAGNIQKNKDAIKVNSDKLTNHEDRITTNESNIERNAEAIKKETNARIDADQQEAQTRAAEDTRLNTKMDKGFATIQGQQDEQDAKIGKNQKDIQTNAGNIQKNKDAIKVNSDKLTNHEDRITTNESNIERNAETIKKVQGDVVDEVAARQDAEQKLQTQINNNNTSVNNEAAERKAADQNLQNQINNNSTSINDLYGRYSSLKTDINKVGARSAALAGLHPLDFDPANKLNFAVASGSFKGENSVALGAFYRPNENIMFSAASTMGDSDNAYTFGLSFKIGPSSAKTKTTSPDAEELYKVVGELQDQLAAQQKEIEQLKADKAK